MRSTDIVNLVGNLTFENAFNPYSDRCRVHDTPDAPGIRRQFLREILRQAHRVDVDAIWVGRDLGYRGGRRTGLALTDDIHFSDHLERWGLEPENLTTGEPVPERTAGVIWDVLHHVRAPVFLWNVFPLHPFRNSDEFSNRPHSAREREAGMDILKSIVEHISPRQIVAIGNDAFRALSAAFPCNDIHRVRHPSYGGQSEFLRNMHALYPEAAPELYRAVPAVVTPDSRTSGTGLR